MEGTEPSSFSLERWEREISGTSTVLYSKNVEGNGGVEVLPEVTGAGMLSSLKLLPNSIRVTEGGKERIGNLKSARSSKSISLLLLFTPLSSLPSPPLSLFSYLH